ncbi:hypothetical protein [Streptomyces sp. I05A-00742]|uniref:hypothetical protein n=1 Tax=Streptomyces sp. I05A-00742 TaxID=2732853 RepID=UPI00148A07D0|nr:hypothetical protein [Streptomyces sp. I05A-00742]
MGIPELFLRREGGALHLLECRGCTDQRTLTRRFQVEVVRAHLEETEHHGRCHHQAYARYPVDTAQEVLRFELACGRHTARWVKDVTPAEAALVVRAFVDAALDVGQQRPAEPGTG